MTSYSLDLLLSVFIINTVPGSIPIGIVSARQRTEAEKLSSTSSSSSRPPLPEPHRTDPLRPGLTSDMGSMPLPPSGPLVSGIGLPSKTSHMIYEEKLF